jgi:uncharacterized protein YuzE
MLEYKKGRCINMGIQVKEYPNLNIKLESIKNLENIMPSYDKKFDTFFISPSKPVPAVSVDWNGEFWLRVASNGDVVGLEVENFEKVFLVKYPEVKVIWKDVKHICIKNEKKLTKKSLKECEPFLRILLTFLSELFKTHPSQQTLLPT